jgi:hypothetical protein
MPLQLVGDRGAPCRQMFCFVCFGRLVVTSTKTHISATAAETTDNSHSLNLFYKAGQTIKSPCFGLIRQSRQRKKVNDIIKTKHSLKREKGRLTIQSRHGGRQ